jgi:signal transduction histidine kinase
LKILIISPLDLSTSGKTDSLVSQNQTQESELERYQSPLTLSTMISESSPNKLAHSQITSTRTLRLALGRNIEKSARLGRYAGRKSWLFIATRNESPLRHKVEEIKKAGVRAASLTRQLLAFSRKQVLHPVVLDINSLVTDVGKMLRRLVGEDIEFVTLLRPKTGSVHADPGQIEQVIMNLVVNARDAMPHGGKLAIETANVYFDADYVKQHVGARPGPYVMLAVSDTGTGMDEQTRARIFEPFFTTKELGKGHGFGTIDSVRNREAVWRIYLGL